MEHIHIFIYDIYAYIYNYSCVCVDSDEWVTFLYSGSFLDIDIPDPVEIRYDIYATS